jgi:hypothetical protein
MTKNNNNILHLICAYVIKDLEALRFLNNNYKIN